MTWQQIRDEILAQLEDLPEEHKEIGARVAEDAARMAARAIAGDPPSDASLAHIRAQAANLGAAAKEHVLSAVMETIGVILRRVVRSALGI